LNLDYLLGLVNLVDLLLPLKMKYQLDLEYPVDLLLLVNLVDLLLPLKTKYLVNPVHLSDLVNLDYQLGQEY
jgi:hypothetical protein